MIGARLTRWLERSSPAVFAAVAMTAAFSAYACMYAFRKPFTVGRFAGVTVLGLDYKTMLVAAQVVGYMISKFIGIRLVSAVRPERRALGILVLVGIAWLALAGLAVAPPWLGVACLLANGLPLGMVWGLVFGFLEGRRSSELLAAGLSASFIVSSGLVKTVGHVVLHGWGVPEAQMPAVVGGLFALPLLASVWLLHHLPPPSAEDEAERSPRTPMTQAERRTLLVSLWPGLLLLTIVYMGLTAYRDLRDSFAADILAELGHGASASAFTITELPVALVALLALGGLRWIRGHHRALAVVHLVVMLGAVVVAASTWAFQRGWLPPLWWIGLTGLGLYLAYVPFNSILFDRVMAAFRFTGNAGFLIYVADAFGYLASVGLFFYRSFGHPDVRWSRMLVVTGYGVAGLGLGLGLLSVLYFRRRAAAAAPASRAGRTT
jgi:hypothetical protein